MFSGALPLRTKVVTPASFNTKLEIALYPGGDLLNGPVKNRMHEAGWLTLLIEMGVATEKQAHDAMRRVAQAAIGLGSSRVSQHTQGWAWAARCLGGVVNS